jgi:hypothetical protein
MGLCGWQSLGHDNLSDMSTHASNAVFLIMWPIFNVLLVNLLVAGVLASRPPTKMNRLIQCTVSWRLRGEFFMAVIAHLKEFREFERLMVCYRQAALM